MYDNHKTENINQMYIRKQKKYSCKRRRMRDKSLSIEKTVNKNMEYNGPNIWSIVYDNNKNEWYATDKDNNRLDNTIPYIAKQIAYIREAEEDFMDL